MVKSLDLSCVVCLIKLMGLFRFCEQQVMCLRGFDEEEREDTIKRDFAQFLRILGDNIFPGGQWYCVARARGLLCHAFQRTNPIPCDAFRPMDFIVQSW